MGSFCQLPNLVFSRLEETGYIVVWSGVTYYNGQSIKPYAVNKVGDVYLLPATVIEQDSDGMYFNVILPDGITEYTIEVSNV